MELNNDTNAFEMTLLYPEARFVIIDIAKNKDDLKELVEMDIILIFIVISLFVMPGFYRLSL